MIRKQLSALLHIHDSPRRTAAAYSLGVFWGFSPFLGFHTALALACAFAFNLNRAAVLLGVYSNLPWIIAAYYALATALGAMLLGAPATPQLPAELRMVFRQTPLNMQFWRLLSGLMHPLLWPYAVGSTLGALVLALVAYRLALIFLTARRDSWATNGY